MRTAELRPYERNARRVRRGYLRLSPASSRTRAVFFLEESLRLVSLPGEDDGRVYYFRSVVLPELSLNASRDTWLRCIENNLRVLAQQAVHASDPRASWASAVFFDTYQQALELSLSNLLKSSPSSDWFWPHVVEIGGQEALGAKIPALIELALRQPSSWSMVADLIFAALDSVHPAVLLAALPLPTVHAWLRELDCPGPSRKTLTSIRLPQPATHILSQAARYFGWNDPRTVWLTSLAIIRSSRINWEAANALERAHIILRATKEYGRLSSESALTSASSDAANNNPLTQDIPLTPHEDDSISENLLLVAAAPLRLGGERAASDEDLGKSDPAEASPLTKAAGLYFLLNALRRLGIEAALQSCPALAEADFIPHLVRRLANQARVPPGDPILAWTTISGSERDFILPESEFSNLPGERELWPANLALAGRTTFNATNLLRAWCVAVRRWCWRSAKVTVRDVVSRNGSVRWSRAELDVILPLDAVDIRIRRAGLDIDPGRVPWFGRVVRFHYR